MSSFTFVSAGKKNIIEGVKYLAKGQYCEEKFDGSRFGVHRRADGSFEVLSRGGIDRIDNIPYIIEELKAMKMPNSSVLDCETIVMDPDRKLRWELTRSVMGTKGYNPDVQKVHLLVFGVQWWDGEYVGDNTYLEQRKIIHNFIDQPFGTVLHDTYRTYGLIAYPRAWPIAQYQWLWKVIVDDGNGEGIMLKSNDPGKAYGKTWTKIKKEDTIDCFILGATAGKGKYEGQIGTVELAVYANDAIYPIGKISNVGTDADRAKMTDLALAGELKGKVIEVKYNEVTKGLKLRHGRFIRWRDDKERIECLISQIKDN